MKVGRKLILIVIGSVALVTIPAVALIDQLTQKNLLSNEAENLRIETQALASVHARQLSKAEPNLKTLAHLLNKALALPPQIAETAAFDRLMKQEVDGAWRNPFNPFDEQQEAGVFLPPAKSINAAEKIFHVRAKHILDIFGSSLAPPFNNIWLLTHEKTEIIFDHKLPDFVHQMPSNTDYTQTEWMKLASPKEDPERKIRWTQPLFDPVPRSWMVSAVMPLDLHGNWMGVIGHDLYLNQVLPILFQPNQRFSGEYHFLRDAEGHYIQAGPWQSTLEASPVNFKPNLSDEPELAQLLTLTFSEHAQSFEKPISLQGSSYLAVGIKMQPLGWQYLRLVPTEQILMPIRYSFAELLAVVLAIGVLVGLLIEMAVQRNIVFRLQTLAKSVRRYGSGDLSARAQVIGDDEIAQAAHDFDAMAEQLKATLDAIPDLLFEMGLDGRYYSAHSPRHDLLAAPPLELIGKTVTNALPPAAAQIILAALQEAERNDYSQGKQFELPLPIGNCWFELSVAKKLAAEDGSARFIVMSRDITERKKIELDLQEQLRFASSLNRIGSWIVELEDSHSLLEEIILEVSQTLGADRGLIYDVSYSRNEANGISEWINPLHPETPSSKSNHSLELFRHSVTEVRRSQTCLSSQDHDINPLLIADGVDQFFHQKLGIKSLLWHPLAFRDDGFYLLVLNQLYQTRVWHQSEIDFLDSISHLLDVAVEKIRLINERALVEQDLRISATAFEAREGMMITDADQLILRVNHAFTHITGYTAEEVIGQSPKMLSSGQHNASFYEAMWERIYREHSWEGEIWNKRKNGEIYPEYLTITAVNNQNGLVVNYVATFTDITANKAAEKRIEQLAFYDPLTNLPNRRMLADRLQQALASSFRSGRQGAILFIDLDHFKTINDTLGHAVGDQLLQQVAQRLNACVREGDTVARLGGDEFVVMLEDLNEQAIDSAAQVEVVGAKILTALSQPYLLTKHELNNTPSIGATLFNGTLQSVDDLLKQADIAMYQVKQEGRNSLRFFDPKMQSAITARAALEDELRQALDKQQFELHFQIQTDSTRTPIGAEALIRWRHPVLGIVSPQQFISLAEETALILPIGIWVLEAACQQIKLWQNSASTRDLRLAVNVSAKQFQQNNFAAQVLAAIEHHEIPANRLKLELTESMLVDSVEQTISTMNQLKKLGVQFSLDDFGTGFSSLQYLKRLPLDQLKIDQSFVRDLTVDIGDQVIVRTIIAMAHSLNLEVIAEGVETEAQLQRLLHKGCTRFQGYLFSKPLPIYEFETLLNEKTLKIH
jgi:diguanylate cyclase (GGDEF)-like protein/PAS domain S-box-containing protein